MNALQLKSKINYFNAHLEQVKNSHHYSPEMRERLIPVYEEKINELNDKLSTLQSSIKEQEPTTAFE